MENLREYILKLVSKSTFISFLLLTGCASWIPGMEDFMDDYITDDAVSISIHKEALQKDTDLCVSVGLLNKEVR